MHMEVEAVKLSPRARSALRGALKESLGQVRKKIRNIRAKKMDGSYEDEDVKTFNKLSPEMVESGESLEQEANESPEEMEEEEEEGIETPEDHTRAEREAFFRKSTKPKVGKVKSALGMGKTMAAEEKDFGRKSKMRRNPSVVQPQSQKTSAMRYSPAHEEKDFARKNKMTRNPAGMMRNGGRGH